MIKSKRFGTLVGTYGKGIDGSLTINFSVSGGKNCSDTCPLKGNGCYAETAGKRRSSITVNLLKKESAFSEMLAELVENAEKIAAAPWVRFSAFGSIPSPDTWTDADRDNLAKLARALDHSKVHFPVETVEKAQALRAVGFFPRVSDGEADHAGDIPVSRVFYGEKVITGSMKLDRIREITKPAFEAAKTAPTKTRVCPAIAGNAHCGACKMCAGTSGIQTVIYPRHV